jgi:hypothetical protein
MTSAHLYVIQSGVTGAIKVGRSDSPARRLHQLQTGSPYVLRIILVLEGGGPREREVHRRLDSWKTTRIAGAEWFSEEGLGSIPDDIWEHALPWYLDNPDWWRQDVAFRKTGQSVTVPSIVELDFSDPQPVVGQVEGDKVWDGTNWIDAAEWEKQQEETKEVGDASV